MNNFETQPDFLRNIKPGERISAIACKKIYEIFHNKCPKARCNFCENESFTLLNQYSLKIIDKVRSIFVIILGCDKCGLLNSFSLKIFMEDYQENDN